jgi:predicted permease
MFLRVLYRALMLAYPRDFRREHGSDAVRLFLEACQADHRTRGTVGVLARVGRALVDVPTRGFAERAASRRHARWPVALLSDLGHDVRYGLRALRRSPTFTIIAILTMTIGIALSTAMFTTFNAVALRGWPVEHAGTLVLIAPESASPQGPSGFGLDDLERFRRSQTLTTVAGSRRAFNVNVALEPGGRGEGGFGGHVTPEFVDATGVRLILGRNFRSDEDREGASEPVVIISYLLWQRLFAGSADVIGRTVYIGKTAHTIIGVAREGWRGQQPYRDDVWLPLHALRTYQPQDTLFLRDAGRCCLEIVGRLAPGESRARAAAELTTLIPPGPDGHRHRVRVSGTSMLDRTSGYVWTAALTLVVVATALVLLLTGANIAHLQLARAMARAREIRTRIALGAGRGRVVRQLIGEAMLLTVVAGVLAMAVVYALLDTLMRISEMELRDAWTPDAAVYGYCIGVSLAMSVTFSLLPALRSARIGLAHGAGQTVTAPRLRFNLALLTTQIALSVSLLTGAVLLHRVFVHAIRGDAGFPLDGLTVISYEPAAVSPDQPDAARAIRRSVEHALAGPSLPPIGLLDSVPFSTVFSARVQPEGGDPNVSYSVDVAPMSASAFDVFGIPFVRGRPHADGDGVSEAVLNESAARRIFPGQPAIGRVLVYAKRPYTVVGVTRDVYFASRGTIRPTLHVPAGTARRFPSFVLRADGRAASDQVGAIISRVDPRARVTVRTISDTIADRLRDERMGAQAAWAGGLLALALAMFGVFGVFAYVVEERRREIGIRVALGAEKRDVLNALFRPARVAVVGGLGFGLILSLSLGPILDSMGMSLFGHSPFDPVAFAIVGMILSVAAFVATIIPARRALGVDPSVMLKEDA